MAANPDILNGLKQFIADKTGNPPTGGDGKATPPAKPATPVVTGGGGTPTPPARIPLPNYDDPQSRLNYAKTIRDKYHLPQGYGDVFLRFNEVPTTETDTLTSRQLAQKNAAGAGLPAPLFYSSAMVEGMSGLYPDKNGQTDYSGNEKYPVHGFKNFGLDTFSDAYPGLVKKGYLPANFKQQFIPNVQTNEQKQKVNSAYFSSADAALQAKAAMLRDAQDNVNTYAAKNKIPLSDKAKQFLTLAYYNGGPGAFQGMIQEAQKSGGLANDAYFTNKPAQSRWGQVWNNVNQRFQIANALTGEGYQFEDTPPTK